MIVLALRCSTKGCDEYMLGDQECVFRDVYNLGDGFTIFEQGDTLLEDLRTEAHVDGWRLNEKKWVCSSCRRVEEMAHSMGL